MIIRKNDYFNKAAVVMLEMSFLFPQKEMTV